MVSDSEFDDCERFVDAVVTHLHAPQSFPLTDCSLNTPVGFSRTTVMRSAGLASARLDTPPAKNCANSLAIIACARNELFWPLSWAVLLDHKFRSIAALSMTPTVCCCYRSGPSLKPPAGKSCLLVGGKCESSPRFCPVDVLGLVSRRCRVLVPASN